MGEMERKISVAMPNLCGNEKNYVDDCIESTWISSGGKYIEKFEEAFASFCGSKYAMSCSNGTVAIHLALIALGVKAGDEIIMPDLTYIATANAVKYCGAVPVFVDINEETWNIDAEKVEEKITKKTKGIIVVHLYGNPVEMDRIMEIANKHNLFVVEDAAEAHGAEYKGKRVGHIGHIGTFSFFGNKVITTGEGGMLTTDDSALEQRIRLYKGQGVDPDKRYWHTVVGYNYRMTNIEAALGLAQLENIDYHLERRRQVVKWYMKYLENRKDLFAFQKEAVGGKSIYWMFSIILKEGIKKDRDSVMLELGQAGIETRPLFYPMHIMPPYADKTVLCPISERISRRGMNLPTHGLLNEEDIEYICSNLLKIVEE